MNQVFFKQQVDRLNAQFRGAFSEEKAALLWKEVSNLSDDWMRVTTDKFIGESRYSPTLKEFREELSFAREKRWDRDKEKNRLESEGFMQQIFDKDMVASICKTIGDRLEHKVTDQVFEQFTRGITQLAPKGCMDCDSSGLVFRKNEEGYEFVSRCWCGFGDLQPKAYPRHARVITRKGYDPSP